MRKSLSSFCEHFAHETLVIVQGNILLLRNGDVHYPFRQNSDFLYLTGLPIPDLTLTIEQGKPTLWRDPINEMDSIWGTDKIGDEEIKNISGIENIRDKNDFRSHIDGKCALSETLWKPVLHRLRMKKSPDEITKIQHSISITEKIYKTLTTWIQPGMYEYEVEARIAYEFRKYHGTEAFPTIVASGENSCILHTTKYTRKIKENDILLIDFGIELDGYGADISRTFSIGDMHPRVYEIYQAVELCKKEAENALKPGITRTDWNIHMKEYIYDTCRNLGVKNIENVTPLANPYFPHSIGHFLGLDTHDVGESDIPLEPGMILTIEPGIYIRDEGIGVRIEDDYLVTENGCIRL